MTIDELVDKVLSKHKNEDEKEIKTTFGPFRYITNEEEIQQELESQKPAPFSVLDVSEKKSIYELEPEIFTLALGDLQVIESILKKHESIRRNKME